jgi:hypothetical protein
MQKLSNLPKWVRQLGGVFLAFVLFWLICDIAVDGSLTRKYHQQLLQEFPLIQPFPGSVVVKTNDLYSRLTAGRVLVGADYATNAAYPAIYQHYDKELNSKGVAICGGESYKDYVWRRRNGEKILQRTGVGNA